MVNRSPTRKYIAVNKWANARKEINGKLKINCSKKAEAVEMEISLSSPFRNLIEVSVKRDLRSRSASIWKYY